MRSSSEIGDAAVSCAETIVLLLKIELIGLPSVRLTEDNVPLVVSIAILPESVVPFTNTPLTLNALMTSAFAGAQPTTRTAAAISKAEVR